ncbi:MAG: co-chaperone GroES [Candidatus Moraniibacteriota bacterium]
MAKTTARIRPLGENVLLLPEKQEKKTATGIYLPENTTEERRQQGKVVAIGDDKKISVKKGQAVIFKRYGSTEEIEVGDQEYLLVNCKDILAIIE